MLPRLLALVDSVPDKGQPRVEVDVTSGEQVVTQTCVASLGFLTQTWRIHF